MIIGYCVCFHMIHSADGEIDYISFAGVHLD